MKRLLNTLYVLTPESHLFYRNETVCVKIGNEEKVAVPAVNIDSIVCFGRACISTPLIGYCAEKGISLVFLTEYGRFLARVEGPVSGNVLLRKKQYESLNDQAFQTELMRSLLFAKFRNSKAMLLRFARNNENGDEALYKAAAHISELAVSLSSAQSADTMRGIEGAAANAYFSCFDEMLGKSCRFRFKTRSRRPPLNEVNAALSFVYMLLCREIQSAAESVGLDPAAGYLHTLRPGRPSLALDFMEELRSPLCDRFVISLFHLKQLSEAHFEKDADAVYLNEKGRRIVLSAWQKRKEETIVHPFLEEKIKIGLIPYAQSMLFARVLRGDLDCYPPFVWR